MTFKNQKFADRECRVCGTSFKCTHPQQILCSTKCVKLRNNKKRRERRLVCDKDKNNLRKYYKNNPIKRLLNSARARAKRFNLDFNIDSSDIAIPDRCPMLGTEIYQGEGEGRTGNAPSLDRINNNLGYVKGNVHVISDRANRFKSNMTLNEAELLVKFLRSLSNGK